MVQQRQQGGRTSDRRREAIRQARRHIRMMRQQMVPRGRVFPYPGQPDPDVSMPNGAMGGMPMRDASIYPPVWIRDLASALATASPDDQTMMLGECLYPLILARLDQDAFVTSKVTGMILEMDHTDILHLLESPDNLSAKVDEALVVLRDADWPWI